MVGLASTRLMADEALKYWPQWRGPTWNGVALQADPPVTWSETENLRWKTSVDGKGWGTPIIWGERIFLLTAIALDKKMAIPDVIPAGTPNINLHPQVVDSWKPQKLAIVCIDRITGKLLWSQTVHEAMPHQGHHRKGAVCLGVTCDGRPAYLRLFRFVRPLLLRLRGTVRLEKIF